MFVRSTAAEHASLDDDEGVIRALVDPPDACPGCLALAGRAWPEGTTSRFCARCLATMRRAYQCRTWNADPDHQRQAGHASFAAFSARWRASSGLVPLSAEAVRRYLTPEHVRGPLGALLPARLRGEIYRAWCAGHLLPVEAWLTDEPAPDPEGRWARRAPDGTAGAEGDKA